MMLMEKEAEEVELEPASAELADLSQLIDHDESVQAAETVESVYDLILPSKPFVVFVSIG